MKSITSNILGELKAHEKIKNWWRSEPTFFELLSKELPATFMDCDLEEDPKFITEADAAITNFQALQTTYKFEIAKYVLPDFQEFCSYVDKELIPASMKNVNELTILNFVYPTELFVSRRTANDQDMYVLLTCECEWDQEHGLQLVFRQGKKLTRVSGQDGHLTHSDAYEIPDSEDELLSKFE